MVKAVYVLGGGGHARAVLDALLASDVKVAGVLDPSLSTQHRVLGVPVMGGDSFLDELDPKSFLLVNGLGANPRVEPRKEIYESMKRRGFTFAPVRHPFAVVGRQGVLGEGSQLLAGSVLQPLVQLGENAVVNTGASIDHDCVIGANAFISPGAVLCGGVTVGESAFIGAGATVLAGVAIGANAIVGAGGVVTRAVEAGWTVAGNPAVRIEVHV